MDGAASSIDRIVISQAVGDARRRNPRTDPSIFDFIGEPWDERVLNFHAERGSARDVRKFPQNPEATRPLYPDAMGRWRTEMTGAEADVFKALAGPLLLELGYETDNSWSPVDGEPPR